MSRVTKETLLANLRASNQPTQDAAWATFWANLEDWVDSTHRPYKIYNALLNQSSTNAPVATVLQDEIGGVTFTRDDEGIYYANSSALFTADKTACFVTTSDQAVSSIVYSNTSEIEISTSTDGILVNALIEIRIYD